MPLRKQNNGRTGGHSWKVRFPGGRQPITLGPAKKLSRRVAQSYHDMIMSIIATIEGDETFDSKQQAWLKKIPDSLHKRLEKQGLVRERAARRSTKEYSLSVLVEQFLEMKEQVVKPATMKSLKQAFRNLKGRFSDGHDIRDITPTEATNLPRWMKINGRKVGEEKLSDSAVAKRIDNIKSFFAWATSEGILERNVFGYGVKTTKKSVSANEHYVTLSETQDLFNSQYTLRDLALIVLARFMGFRAAADSVWIRNRDVRFADGDCSRAEIVLDSVKTGSRICPLFHDANYLILKLLCDAEPNPDGFLFKGEKFDRIRSGDAQCDLSLTTKFGGRYKAYTGGDIIPRLFTNCRRSWVGDLVNVFGFKQHEAATYIGHTKAIQEEHYLRPLEDDHKEAMAKWADLKNNPQNNPLCHTSHLLQMVYIALQKNLPELVPAAEKHATRITKIGKNNMFRNQEVDATSSHPLILSGAENSGGGTQETGIVLGKYRVAKIRGVKTTPKTTPSRNSVSLTPTLLAQIWSELGEVEQGKVEQVILDYVEAQQDVEVE